MTTIVSASRDLKFHQWPEGVLVQNYLPRNHEGFVQSISWGKDGAWMVLVPDTGLAEIIAFKDNIKLLQTIEGVSHPTCASFQSTTKKFIGVGTLSGQILIYDIKGKSVKKRFPRVSSKICSLNYNCKDTHVAATCNNGEILMLSNLTGNISTIYKIPNTNFVTSDNFHCSKRNLYAAGGDIGILATWDIHSNQMLCSIQAHQAPISSLVFSPLRIDVLVTGGLDRKFCFYDLSLLKPVMYTEVHNAITSLDFSHCGIYLGVGFQDGKIAVYDVRRNLNTPLSMFEAHPGCGTRHLLFQKVLSSPSENNSVFDITAEETSSTNVDNDRGANNLSVFDTVGMVYDESCHQSGDVSTSKHPQESADSFMIAMGLNNSDHTDSTRNESSAACKPLDNYRKLSDSSKHYNAQHTTSLQLPKSGSIKSASTPKYPNLVFPNATESPILSENKTHVLPNTPIVKENSTNDLQKLIKDIVQKEVKDIVQQEVRDIVRQEVKSQTDSLRATIRDDFTDMLYQIRRYFFDLQMSVVKEFVNMETILEQQSTLLQQQDINCKENVRDMDECRTRKC